MDNVIELLERALEEAKAGSVNRLSVGLLAVRAAEAAGLPPTLLELARQVRAKGLGAEADLVTLAMDVASAAMNQEHELYEHSLIALHDLACERLDEVEHEPAEESVRESTASRFN